MRLQVNGIHIDLDLAVLAPKRLGHRGAWHICDLIAHRELPEVVQLSFVQSRAPSMRIRHTGKLDASNFRTTGGRVPGGRRRNCAIARFEICH